MKSMLFALALTFAFGSLAVQINVHRCLRLYCKADAKTKIVDEKGHGSYFPAMDTEDRRAYQVDYATYESAKSKCQGVINQTVRVLLGADANKSEVRELRLNVVPFQHKHVTFINNKCAELEKK